MTSWLVNTHVSSGGSPCEHDYLYILETQVCCFSGPRSTQEEYYKFREVPFPASNPHPQSVFQPAPPFPEELTPSCPPRPGTNYTSRLKAAYLRLGNPKQRMSSAKNRVQSLACLSSTEKCAQDLRRSEFIHAEGNLTHCFSPSRSLMATRTECDYE